MTDHWGHSPDSRSVHIAAQNAEYQRLEVRASDLHSIGDGLAYLSALPASEPKERLPAQVKTGNGTGQRA
jgi:hypothetical protein